MEDSTPGLLFKVPDIHGAGGLEGWSFCTEREVYRRWPKTEQATFADDTAVRRAGGRLLPDCLGETAKDAPGTCPFLQLYRVRR
eukprot:gene15348-biopygen17178